MKHILIFILISMCLQGCSSIKTWGSYVNLVPNKALENVTKEQINAVKVYYKESPTGKFEEVAIVEAVASGGGAGLEHVFSALKTQAALIQGDGVFKIEIERYSGATSNIHATGVVIRKL